jgi:hypothetical protein
VALGARSRGVGFYLDWSRSTRSVIGEAAAARAGVRRVSRGSESGLKA